MKPACPQEHAPGASCSSCAATAKRAAAEIMPRNIQPGQAIFAEEAPVALTAEQEKLKRGIYEKMNPRRRKFVDRIGYDVWNPFQAPNDPLDIRTDRTSRTLQDLVRDFMRDTNCSEKDGAWRKGVMECALGIIRKDEKYQGIYDFCVWYQNLLRKEGHLE